MSNTIKQGTEILLPPSPFNGQQWAIVIQREIPQNTNMVKVCFLEDGQKRTIELTAYTKIYPRG